jgi:hypothetical protein
LFTNQLEQHDEIRERALYGFIDAHAYQSGTGTPRRAESGAWQRENRAGTKYVVGSL